MKEYNHIKDLDMSIVTEVIDYGSSKALPEASIVIVTYNTGKKLLAQNLDSLSKQKKKDFEILIVDNSDKTDIKPIVSKYILKYIKLKKNYGLSLARNVGTKFARGAIVIFLDDDAIPAHNFVEKHIRAYKEYDIFGLRGKSLPRTPSIYNYLASHYDLGDQTMPCPINLEGNSSFKRDVLIEMGGFNPELQKAGGHEGTELTYRIVKKYNDKSKLVYYPNAVIYHDFSDTFVKYIKKQLRHAKYSDMLKCLFPDIFDFAGSYNFGSKKMMNKSLNLIIRIKLKVIQELVSLILKVRKLVRKGVCGKAL